MFDFPDTPTVGQIATNSGIQYRWDGTKWASANAPNLYAPLASPAFTGIPTSPTGGYGDASTQLATDAFVQHAVAPAFDNIGRNKLHNPLFQIAQRTLPITFTGPANGYSSDRWWAQASVAGESIAVSLVDPGDSVRTAIGDEEARQVISLNVTGSSTANNVCLLEQRVEGVRRLSGKTVILSFWAASSLATVTIGAWWQQTFGTGGTPSAPVSSTVQNVPITNTWTRYSVTIALPSAAGKTFGTTAGTDYTRITFILSQSTSVGVNTGVFQIWGTQLEIVPSGSGMSQPSQLEKLDPRLDLSNCQRFFQIVNCEFAGYCAGAYNFGGSVPLPVQMRAPPTITLSNISLTNLPSISATAYSWTNSVVVTGAATATAATSFICTVAVSADL